METLVLGGNGFIGSHLVDRLLLAGHAVRVFDRNDEQYRNPLGGVDYRFADFGNRTLLAEALDGVDIVFHLISTTVPKTSNDDPVFDVTSNVIETIALLEKCVALGVRKVVFLSSGGTVYGAPTALPVSEENSTNPECSYGITKLAVEKYLALFNHLYGLDYVVIRPSNPYGPRQNPLGIQGAISVFLGRVAAGRPIEVWGDGEIVRDYVYVGDLVEGIYRAALQPTLSRVYNLGSGEGHSLNAIIAIMRSVIGDRVQVVYKPGRVFDVPKIYLDISRAQMELNWRPEMLLAAGIRETWEFVQSIVGGSARGGIRG